MELSDEQVSQFETEGFLIVDRIITDDRVECILEAMRRVYNGQYTRDVRPAAEREVISPFGTKSSVQWIIHGRLLDSDLWDLATDPILGKAAARLLKTTSVTVIEDQLLDKPDRSAPVAFHQDYSYWRFSSSTNTLTCWLALTDVTADMGPVECIRGSHRWGIAPRIKDFVGTSDEEYLSAARNFVPSGLDPELVPALVSRGGGVFFHGLTIHGSRGNSSNQWRRATALHWAAAESRFDTSKLDEYGHKFIFAGLRQGDPLFNEFIPRVPAS